MAPDHARENIHINVVCQGDTFVQRWVDNGYFEGAGGVNLEEALSESGRALPLGRMGRPEEIARVILFLASGDSSFDGLSPAGGWRQHCNLTLS